MNLQNPNFEKAVRDGGWLTNECYVPLKLGNWNFPGAWVRGRTGILVFGPSDGFAAGPFALWPEGNRVGAPCGEMKTVCRRTDTGDA